MGQRVDDRIAELEQVNRGQSRTIEDLERQLARVKACVDGLRDERDKAIGERNTALARLGALQRAAARPSILGSSDMHGLDNLDEAIAIASAGQRI
jgi:hypothetical protein